MQAMLILTLYSLSQTFISYHPHPISRNRNVTLGSNRLR